MATIAVVTSAVVMSAVVASAVVTIGAVTTGVMEVAAERSQSDVVATGAEMTDVTRVGLLSLVGVGMTVETTGAGSMIASADMTQVRVIKVAENGAEWPHR